MRSWPESEAHASALRHRGPKCCRLAGLGPEENNFGVACPDWAQVRARSPRCTEVGFPPAIVGRDKGGGVRRERLAADDSNAIARWRLAVASDPALVAAQGAAGAVVW